MPFVIKKKLSQSFIAKYDITKELQKFLLSICLMRYKKKRKEKHTLIIINITLYLMKTEKRENLSKLEPCNILYPPCIFLLPLLPDFQYRKIYIDDLSISPWITSNNTPPIKPHPSILNKFQRCRKRTGKKSRPRNVYAHTHTHVYKSIPSPSFRKFNQNSRSILIKWHSRTRLKPKGEESESPGRGGGGRGGGEGDGALASKRRILIPMKIDHPREHFLIININ